MTAERDQTMSRSSVSLSDTQLSVMRALWRAGEADVQDVCDAMERDGRSLAYTTVATLLKRLEKRGLVAHRKEGRKQIFQARISEDEVRRSMVAGLIGSLFKGDSRALVSHLVRSNEVDEDDLEELQRMIEEGKRS